MPSRLSSPGRWTPLRATPRGHITEAAEEQLVTKDIQVFGPPNDAVLGMIEQLSQSGAPLIVKPKHLAGFTRAAGIAEKS